MYVRAGGQQRPLAALYAGPLSGDGERAKVFKVQIGQNVETSAVDRLKPHTGSSPLRPAKAAFCGRPKKQAAAPSARKQQRTQEEWHKNITLL